MLDPNSTDPAYCCGRAFALLEVIQKDSAERQPQPDDQGQLLLVCQHDTVAGLSRLCRLSQHHLAKLDTGHRIHREKQLGEVLNKLSTTPGAHLPLPRLLSLEDQGKFVLGYFHQPKDIYTSKKDKEEGATAMSTPIQNRYDFVYFFDVTDGNPNGDPDAGNLPRIDPRPTRAWSPMSASSARFATLSPTPTEKFRASASIFVRSGVLNSLHNEAYIATELKPEPKKLPKDEQKAKELTDWMCLNFFDIRTFGAVMTTEVNCGQVRGPLQLTFSRSIDPVVSAEFAITRCAVTNEKDDKERKIGRKFNVPYGLYRCHGFINAAGREDRLHRRRP